MVAMVHSLLAVGTGLVRPPVTVGRVTGFGAPAVILLVVLATIAGVLGALLVTRARAQRREHAKRVSDLFEEVGSALRDPVLIHQARRTIHRSGSG